MVRSGHHGRPLGKSPDKMPAARILFLILVVSLAATGGCSKRADVKGEASELEKAFASTTPAPSPDSAQDSIGQHAAAAVAALKASDYSKASDELMELGKLKGLTAEQRMKLNQVSSTLMQELIARSAKGDTQAKAALERRRIEMDRR